MSPGDGDQLLLAGNLKRVERGLRLCRNAGRRCRHAISNAVCEMATRRKQMNKPTTIFHTSHPGLCAGRDTRGRKCLPRFTAETRLSAGLLGFANRRAARSSRLVLAMHIASWVSLRTARGKTNPMNVFLCGQKQFGASVLEAVAKKYKILGVSSPAFAGHLSTDGSQIFDRVRATAERLRIPWQPQVRADSLPAGTDIIVAAHSHDFIGRKTRARANFGGYRLPPFAPPATQGP